ncbi:MAG: gliding motility protein GldN [Saprospiraceae bacterium]|nr:gliding motility protein GldN [Saprospiraceae bacterium]
MKEIQSVIVVVLLALFSFVSSSTSIKAQGFMTESGQMSNASNPSNDSPYKTVKRKGRPLLAYDFVHEKDVLWEKRIWRSINLKEKMNHFFRAEKNPLISIIIEEAQNQEITLYSTFDDEFSTALTREELLMLSGSYDTIMMYDPESFEEIYEVVYNEFDPQEVKEYRIKEVWFFDEETSTMNVRIIGIAPIRDMYDNNGNFIARTPMFWMYYPDARPILHQYIAPSDKNDAFSLSWTDIFDAHYFASRIIKESNLYDRRLQDYLEPEQALLEGEKIHQEIFNFEHDLWSY